ncbi:hypothetical protein NDA13_003726 [Ustilago tritici]|nr:hypothetical protein NDA13_003726 [Ustilago tritici]
MAAAACKTCTNALASAPTTAATTAASASSRPTPPLPPTIFLTKDSPAFCGLQQQLDDQMSALSNIAASLQQLLASLRNPKPRLPQPPSSQPVAATLASATLPAANTAGSALGAPLPGESDVDRIFSWLLREVIQQVIDDALPPQDLGRLHNPDSLPVDNEHEHAVLVNGVLIKSVPSAASTSSTCHFTKLIPNTDCTHTWPSVASYILTTYQRRFGHALAALWAQQDQAAWNQHLSTADSFCPPPKSATPGSANRQANTQPSGPPSKRQKGLKGSARHIDGPAGLPNLSTPPLRGLARLVGDSASMLNLGTPPLQGSARSVIMPAGLGGTRTPLLQGLARLFDLVPAALDVPSADWCLSLLLNAWSHNPGPHPNTSSAGNVFDPASQPARHSSMQERAFAWSTLLSLYPDPVYRCQLLGMTKHGCLLGYDGPLRNANRRSDNLPISSAGHTAALPSVNADISPGFIRIRYEGLQDLLAFVSQNPGCLLWKGNLEDAFWHVMTAKRNAHLLGFSYNGIRYRKNTLTFGGSSSPWLFNLVAEFLHWLVVACLPANWPVNHYLDNTFGAVPVSHATHALLPIHILALAANALGLWLSPKKTFGASTKLKVLGVEIDTVAQTVGITDDQCHCILAQCRSLLQCRSADLLDMQWIASLLQFVSQVFPCRKAFLRCLYDATCRALPGKCHLTWPACSEFIWWCDILECWSGTSILSPLPLTAAHIWTNACPKGYGGYLGLNTSPTAVFAKTVPRPPPGVTASLGVSARAANLLWHGLAASTHRHAGGAPSSFQSFCLRHFGFGTSCFPAISLQLLEWLAHLSSLGRPFHSAKHGLGALQSHHMDLGLDTSGFSCSRLEHALCGYKHLHGVGHSGTKLPVTLLLLRQVLLAVGKMANLFPQDCLVLQAAFALAFACFLRSGKLVWDRGTDCATILTVSSIEWASDHVVLTLPASKTDPFRQGVCVVTPEVGGVECPVAYLWHLSHGHPPLAPLFGLDLLPRSTFVTILRCTIQACSLLVLQYTSHSFHCGMATWVLQHSASTANIQSLGWWSSNCYCCYINRLAQECRALVASALFSVRDGPLVPSSPAWRDPGLA